MSYMGQQAEGYAVVGVDGIDLHTVYPSRRGAIVNWLVTSAKIPLSSNASDDFIEQAWAAHSIDARVALCQVEVRVLNDD